MHPPTRLDQLDVSVVTQCVSHARSSIDGRPGRRRTWWNRHDGTIQQPRPTTPVLDGCLRKTADSGT
ncbi:hypothetical protein ZHAS_00009909 [Anopheles sinensis]|uniref:Uncharacterized protein n=1 Tax=Anopheles sinensis TaxID=74873 RepID=A0A084VW81_ANOSI|nr:hypothetical protein ZHAS_00009909 [Anopheles sinensis]